MGGLAEGGQRVAECREGGGTHIDPGNHPALPGLLRHLSELLPPVHHLALAPPTSLPPPQPPPVAPPSLSRATFCVPAMLGCRVFMSSSPGVKTAGSRQVRYTPDEGFAPHLVSQAQIRRTRRAFHRGGHSFSRKSYARAVTPRCRLCGEVRRDHTAHDKNRMVGLHINLIVTT